MIILQLFFKQNHKKVVEFTNSFKLFFQDMIVVSQFSFFLVAIAFHKESFESGFVIVKRLNLFFIDSDCAFKIVGFSF